jgi:hypothetical protein
MEDSSYEVSEFYVMKALGKTRVFLILMLPFSLSINLLSFTFYCLFRIFSNISRPKVFFREIIKFIPGIINETIITFRRAFTGIFEVDAADINPAEMEKLKNGQPILHPLFGNSVLVEIEVLNKLKGKIVHIRPRSLKSKKAS